MKSVPAKPELIDSLVASLARSTLFHGMEAGVLRDAANRSTLVQADPGELVTREGDASDAFFVILNGEASVLVRRADGADATEVTRFGPGDSFGEAALLLGEPYGASVKATGALIAARFPSSFFEEMAAGVPGFGLSLARATVKRLQQAIRHLPLPEHDGEALPGPDLLGLLPMEFMQRHRVLPVQSSGNRLTIGFVDGPSSAVVQSIRTLVPGAEVRSVRVSAAFFDAAIGSRPVVGQVAQADAAADGAMNPLDRLLRAMVAEGASDLHLSAGQRPRWRIDGLIAEIPGAQPLGRDTVFAGIEPLIDARWSKQFRETNDVDFSYSPEGGERFRVNVFRDANGTGAVFRHIPTKIPDFGSLGMPDAVTRLCAEPKGLVLVTGPTGSGKSTTLAAMLDLINATREEHVLTLEDPVEFVHPSKRSLVNQREIGSHSVSFGRALRAALREDPDVVLVGEMRDLETVALAMETANTGHLVLATLHTATAPLTVDRIVGMFPPEEQSQIRATLADVLRGVICQNLCRKIGGGRVAALEIMIVNPAISNLIREAKTIQIPSMMQTGKAAGNVLLNDSLAALVKAGKVEPAEALSKAVDKIDLAKRIGVPA
jgi:twitching motility protein PilT